ncbi:MAG: helix-turn-helix domain-containing protein [Methanoregula sp.]|nr:helix-turn-helix domain-containing protein [Methanoregula sp.]
MAEEVVFLEPGDERAQKIAKAMGSQTASDILQLLSEGQKSLTDITDRLAIPMTTAKYHVENLLDAGLLSVSETKYSVKGREVKLYSITNQLLIVAPRHANVRSLLLKYASLFGIVAFGSLIIGIMSPLFGADSLMRSSMNTVPRMAMQQSISYASKGVADGYAANATGAPEVMGAGFNNFSEAAAAANFSLPPETMVPLTQISSDTATSALPLVPDTALAFFLGGVMVIFVLLCYEAYLWKRR